MRSLSAVVVGLLAVTLGFSRWIEHKPAEPLARPLQAIPPQLGAWRASSSNSLGPDVEKVLKATSYVSRTYTDGSTALDFFVAYYATQHAGESMHSPKHCLPGSGWEIAQPGSLQLSAGSQTININRYLIRRGADRRLVLYWYQTGSRVIADEYRAKAFLAWDAMVNQSLSGSIVRVVSLDDPSSAQKAQQFARLAWAEVARCFRG